MVFDTNLSDEENEDNSGSGSDSDSDSDQGMLAQAPSDGQDRPKITQPRRPRVPESTAGRRQRVAFMRELEVMKRLRGPHTVQIYGAITSNKDRLVLVMELMSGGDLKHRLRSLKRAKKVLEEDTLRGIVQDICSGMAFLHLKKTVHGDLKSANVLFDGSGRAKV